MPIISDFDTKGVTKKPETNVINPIEARNAGFDEDNYQLEGHTILLREIEPARCKPWKYHNRDIAWLTKERCSDLIQSIQNHGQNMPAMVREIKDDLNYDFELIYGVRRWFACSQIPNKKLLAQITELDDKTCMILMHAENTYSKDISEFERAYSFAQQMESGVFKNQTEMAEAIGVSQGTISKMIMAAKIYEYEWMQGVFNNKLEIPIKYAYALSTLLKDPIKYDLIKKEVENIKNEKISTGAYPGAANVLKRLIGISKPQNKSLPDLIILSSRDKPVIFCHRNKIGQICIFVEDEVKSLNRSDVEAAWLKALNDHILKLFTSE